MQSVSRFIFGPTQEGELPTEGGGEEGRERERGACCQPASQPVGHAIS